VSTRYSLRVNQSVLYRAAGHYSSHRTVVQAMDEGVIWLAAAGLEEGLRPGRRVSLEFRDDRAMYRMVSEIVAVKDGPVPLLGIAADGEVERLQRREYYRLPVSVPVEARPEGEEEAQWMTGHTLDLSAGGMLLSIRLDVQEGDRLELRVYLGQEEMVPAVAEVVRRESLAGPELPRRVPRRRFGLKFVEIDMRDRDRIVRFIFREQGRLRRTGLL